jgi:hypothetical protein
LPNNLTHLTFFYFFISIKKNVLPNNLTNLIFGYYFNKNIKENVLPKSLIYLKLGKTFNKNIKIPSSIQLLGVDTGSTILNNIPEFIENIYIQFFINDEYNIPITIKKIYVNPEKIPFECVVYDDDIIFS